MRFRHDRIVELDLVRGICLIGMIVHHFVNQARYTFGVDAYAWQTSTIFTSLVRPIFLIGFLGVSGLSTAFSRHPAKRGLRVGLAAIVVSVAMAILSRVTDTEVYIIFNVLHTLAISQLVYALIHHLFHRKPRVFALVLALTAIVFLYAGYPISRMPDHVGHPILGYLQMILGGRYSGRVGMADFMPLAPYGGIFLVTALASSIIYPTPTSLLSGRTQARLMRIVRPILWMGQNPLWVYLGHQPIIILILTARYGLP